MFFKVGSHTAPEGMLEDATIESSVIVGAEPIPRLEVRFVKFLIIMDTIKEKIAVREHFDLLFVMCLLVGSRWEECLAAPTTLSAASPRALTFQVDNRLSDQSVSQLLLFQPLCIEAFDV